MTTTNVQDELLALEDRGWQALTAGQGRAFYADRLADEAYLVLPVGVMDREQSIMSMSQVPAWARFTISNPRTFPLADDVVALTYQADAERSSGDTYTAVMTSVYVRRAGEWKLLLHQQTPLFQPAGQVESGGLS